MSDGEFLKGSCGECGSHIEFPAAGLGRLINCPHCGLKTKLAVEPPPGASAPAPAAPRPVASIVAKPTAKPATPSAAAPAPAPAPTKGTQSAAAAAAAAWEAPAPAVESDPPSGGGNTMLILLVLALVGVVGGGLWWKSRAAAAAARAAAPPVVTNAPPPPPPPPEPAPAPKSLADLKVGAIRFEKTKGSSLVYAVGTLVNNSDHQRFGVKVELNLLNAQGGRLGNAQDYLAILEPRKSWDFRVLVNEPKAVSATLAAVREE